MKKPAISLLSIAVLSLCTLVASAKATTQAMSGSNPRPQAMSGSNPRPQAMSGSNPRPQLDTGSGSAIITAILTFLGM